MGALFSCATYFITSERFGFVFSVFLSRLREARLSSSNSPSVVFLLSSFTLFYNPYVSHVFLCPCCLFFPFDAPISFRFLFKYHASGPGSSFCVWWDCWCASFSLYTPWAGILRKVSYSQIFSHEAVKLKSCSLFSFRDAMSCFLLDQRPVQHFPFPFVRLLSIQSIPWRNSECFSFITTRPLVTRQLYFIFVDILGLIERTVGGRLPIQEWPFRKEPCRRAASLFPSFIFLFSPSHFSLGTEYLFWILFILRLLISSPSLICTQTWMSFSYTVIVYQLHFPRLSSSFHFVAF